MSVVAGDEEENATTLPSSNKVLFSPLIEDLNKEKLDAGDDAFVSCYEGETNYRRYVLFLLFTIAVMQNFDRKRPIYPLPNVSG